MNTGCWTSLKSSPITEEIRKALYRKAAPGEKLAKGQQKQVWRETYLGILTDVQKKGIAKAKADRRAKHQQQREQKEQNDQNV